MGDRGTGKSTTIRALADLLPAIDVVKSPLLILLLILIYKAKLLEKVMQEKL